MTATTSNLRRIFKQAFRFEIRQGRLRHAALLDGVDGLGRMAGVGGRARFHFDEHDRAAVDRNNIQLAERRIVTALDDAETQSLEKASGRIFAASAERFLRRTCPASQLRSCEASDIE